LTDPESLALRSDDDPDMRISVFAIDANPAIDTPMIRKSLTYCETEVAADRASWIDLNDVKKGIRLSPQRSGHKTDIRGSKEQSGCLTAHESTLNAQHRGSEIDISMLSQKYEFRLEQHLLQGRKGTPQACDVIAARVKTILSSPGKSL
jgi:hypothetical protein